MTTFASISPAEALAAAGEDDCRDRHDCVLGID